MEPTAFDHLSDFELVERVRGGELRLFEALMRRHNAHLYRVVRSVLRDDAEAEDVLQQTYLSAVEHLGDVVGDTFGPWLRTIAMNEAIRRVRRRHASPFTEEEVDPETHQSSTFGPERQASVSQLREVLERAIDELPDAFREVFILRAVNGLSTAEAAQLLSMPEDTVKTRLHRARGKLQSRLQAWADDVTPQTYAFHASRCDRVVAAVLQKLNLAGA